jgi:hypothetical protein
MWDRPFKALLEIAMDVYDTDTSQEMLNFDASLKNISLDYQLVRRGPVTLVTVFKTPQSFPLCHNHHGYGSNDNHTGRSAEFQTGTAR